MTDYWGHFTVVEKGNERLGGNLLHGDSRSITPYLIEKLVTRFAVRSVLDIGAGEGHAVHNFRRLGVIAHGFDGLERNVRSAKQPLALHDLADGPYIYPCDLAYCVEVVEHVEEKYVDNLMATMCNAPVVAMTHGLPGQPGHHHVNNQPTSYWMEKFNSLGYSLSIDNDDFRAAAKVDAENSYFAESGLVFLKRM